MSHANAALTPKARLRLAQLIVEHGWSVAAAAKLFMVAWTTAKRWEQRYREHGKDGMNDRPSRPRTSPNRTTTSVVKKIVSLRWRKRLGPVQIAYRLGLAASTVHAVLKRCRINRLRYIDRVTGERIRRYEHPYPGAMIHVDVTKFGNIPDDGGHRFLGRQAGEHNSRVAYAEIHQNEKAVTAIAVLQRAVKWFAARNVTVERVLSDNGSAYRSRSWRDACLQLGVVPKRTRPYRPQTNGKIERFHRTLSDGWAYAKFYDSESARRQALPAWIHEYNHHRPHTAIGNQPPISRLTNLPGQYKDILWAATGIRLRHAASRPDRDTKSHVKSPRLECHRRPIP